MRKSTPTIPPNGEESPQVEMPETPAQRLARQLAGLPPGQIGLTLRALYPKVPRKDLRKLYKKIIKRQKKGMP